MPTITIGKDSPSTIFNTVSKMSLFGKLPPEVQLYLIYMLGNQSQQKLPTNLRQNVATELSGVHGNSPLNSTPSVYTPYTSLTFDRRSPKNRNVDTQLVPYNLDGMPNPRLRASLGAFDVRRVDPYGWEISDQYNFNPNAIGYEGIAAKNPFAKALNVADDATDSGSGLPIESFARSAALNFHPNKPFAVKDTISFAEVRDAEIRARHLALRKLIK